MNDGYTLADISAVTNGNRNNNGFMSGDGAWWIVLFLIFGWGRGGYGYGNGGGGVSENYTLISDMGQIERKIDGVYSGICDSTFALNNTITNGFAAAQNTMTQGFAGLNTGMVQQGYENRIAVQGVGSQLAQCCCDLRQQIGDVNYNIANQANGIVNAVNTGFCQTNFNNQQNTRNIIDNQNANARAILEAINNNKVEALKDRIAEQAQTINALNLERSQIAQNNTIINALKPPCPQGAYLVANPNGPLNYAIQQGNCGNCNC